MKTFALFLVLVIGAGSFILFYEPECSTCDGEGVLYHLEDGLTVPRPSVQGPEGSMSVVMNEYEVPAMRRLNWGGDAKISVAGDPDLLRVWSKWQREGATEGSRVHTMMVDGSLRAFVGPYTMTGYAVGTFWDCPDCVDGSRAPVVPADPYWWEKNTRRPLREQDIGDLRSKIIRR